MTLTRRQTLLAAALAALAAVAAPRLALAQGDPAGRGAHARGGRRPGHPGRVRDVHLPALRRLPRDGAAAAQGGLHRHRQGAAGLPRGLLQQAEPLGRDDRALRPGERYFGIVDVLFERQQDWAAAANEQELIGKLFSIGRQAGMTDDQMNACLQDRALAEGLVADYQAKATADRIDATPTFFIDGEMQPNASYEELSVKLDAALGA